MKKPNSLFVAIVFLLLNLVLSSGTSQAVQPLPLDWPLRPANVDTSGFALVLGGGGARGIAHIAILEVLEELNMRPSLIVGTSMGSVVGSLYASGTSTSELRALAVDPDLRHLLVEVKTPLADMQGHWWGQSPHQLSLQISQWPPIPDTGFTYGQGFESLIGTKTADALFKADNNFDHLPIPFRCTSTNLLQYSLVIHDEGPLPLAVKASSTIPLVFMPVELDGRLLVDGGFMDNLPVQVAHRLGFKRVVMVDVSNVHLPDKKVPENLYEMWIKVAELYTVFPNDFKVGENDVLLQVPLEPYRSMSLDSSQEILNVGRQTALQQREQLLALRDACGPAALGSPPQKVASANVTFRNIEVVGLLRMSEDRLLNRLQMHEGDTQSLRQPWEKAAWLTKEGSFHSIGFEYIPVSNDTTDVIIHARDETEPRLELAASIVTDEGAAGLARLRFENMLGRAGTSLVSFQYSDRLTRAKAMVTQSLNGAGWLGLNTAFQWQREKPGLYENGHEIDNYVFRHTQFTIDLVLRSFRYNWSLYAGANAGQSNAYLESRSIAGTGTQPVQTWHLNLESHGRDLPVARHRQGVKIRFLKSFGDTGNSPAWWRGEVGFVQPWERWKSWRPVLAAGAVFSSDDIPVIHQGRAGGPRGWAGLHKDEIIAPQLAWSRLALQYLFSGAIHLEVAGSAGWHGQEKLTESKPLFGGSIEMGAESLLGPVRLGYSLAQQRVGFVYVQIGSRF
ncbi:MAG: patatin-like phospholipase family protein [bacterium]|nr:patatin-like phospholipase family protein [bacterium]